MDWLTNEGVVKLFAKKEGIDEICGIGMVTNQLSLDYFLSSRYFNKHYNGAEIYQCPVVAVAKDARCSHIISTLLVKTMVDELPNDAYGVLLYSKTHNGSLPELFSRMLKDHLGNNAAGYEIDSQGCAIFSKDITKFPLKIAVKKSEKVATGTGNHLTIDGYFGDCKKLSDQNEVYQCLNELPQMLGLQKLMAPIVHQCVAGWNGYVPISEGYINIGSFPKKSLMKADICVYGNDVNFDPIIRYLTTHFSLGDVEVNLLERGSKHP